MKKKLVFLSILFVACFSNILGQQVKSHGIPFIKAYPPEVYQAHAQNWSICQDSRGVMYFGNSFGLLEFDGISWNLLELPNKWTLRTFLKTADGRIYYGGKGDFGYMESDSSGRIKFHSMVNLIPEEHRQFTDVWRIFQSQNKLVVCTYKKIFIIDHEKVKVLEGKKEFHKPFQANGKVYVREWEKGLCVLENDKLKLLPDGEKFKDEQIFSILPYSEKELIIATKDQGFYLYDGQKFTQFKTQFDDKIINESIYCGMTIGKEYFAFGTRINGLYVMDKKGKCVLHLNKDNGLADNTVLNLALDNIGNLWLGHEIGISYIELNSPFSRYGAEYGLNTSIYSSTFYKNVLYIGSAVSIYRKEWEQYENPFQRKQFESIDKTEGQSFYINTIKGKLLNAHNPGLQIIDGKSVTQISYENQPFWTFAPLKNHSDKLFVGSNIGLLVYKEIGSTYQVQCKIKGFDEPANYIAFNDDRTLWISIEYKGIYQLKLNEKLDSVVSTKFYNSESGLPADAGNIATFIGEKLVASTSNKFYCYDSISDNFKLFDAFNKHLANFKKTYIRYVETNGNIWIANDEGFGYFIPQKNGSYQLFRKPFYRFPQIPYLYSVTKINETEYAICTDHGIIHYDAGFKRDYDKTFATILRKVELVGTDSLIFGGIFPVNSDTFSVYQPISQIKTFNYKYNSLRFIFASTFYDSPEKTQYQYKLENFDKVWSNWSKETKKEYTNLPEGEYTFYVKAMNIYHTESNVISYKFKILPPWYRTWFAYILFFILFIIFIIFILKFYSKSLLEQKKYLETVVIERTEEILQQKDEMSQTLEIVNQQKEELAQTLDLVNQQKEEITEQRNQIEKSYTNVQVLSEIGKEITSNIKIENIVDSAYYYVNKLMDASVFDIGIYNKTNNCLDFPAGLEKEVRLPFCSESLTEKRLSVDCFMKQKELIFRNFQEVNDYFGIKTYEVIVGEETSSIIYLPLKVKDNCIGVLTVQCFKENAYTENHLNILRNIAIYTSIALENAQTYHVIEIQKEEIESNLDNLRKAQTELIQAEKMASLGQLVAGIAHEINTPIGAIKASTGSVIAASNMALEKLPRLLKQISKDEEILFFELLEQSKSVKEIKSSSEERVIRKEIKVYLDANKIEDSRRLSDKLTDIRIYQNVEKYLPLLKSPNAENIIQTAFQLSELQKNSQNIELAIERVSKIVFALKNFARKDSSVEKVKTNIIDSIENVLTLYHNLIKQGINIKKNYETVPEIMCYADEINQVWTNLLHNAIQSMKGKGEITITICKKMSDAGNLTGLMIAISDTGQGITDDIKDKIFNAFFTTKPTGEGTGLGLSIVSRIIEKHEGKISFESTIGRGTTFFVELPIN